MEIDFALEESSALPNHNIAQKVLEVLSPTGD
jgi:hypothetical protein